MLQKTRKSWLCRTWTFSLVLVCVINVPVSRTDADTSSGTHDSNNNGGTRLQPSNAGPVDTLFVAKEGDAYYPNNPAFYVGGDIYTVLATAEDTGGALAFLDFYVPPRDVFPQHIHAHESESKYILEGGVTFEFGNASLTSPAGTFVYYAIGRQMGFTATDQPARMAVMATPGAFYYELAGVPVVDAQGDNIAPPAADLFALQQQVDLGNVGRINDIYGGSLFFPDISPPPEPGLLNTILILPSFDDVDPAQLSTIQGLEGLSIFELSDRHTFTDKFGANHIALLTFTETDNTLEYSQFSLAPQATGNSSYQAFLNSDQIVSDTKVTSSGSGHATFTLSENASSALSYNINIDGLDFGAYVGDGTPFTADPADDVIAIHLHTADRGSNGPHTLNILGPQDDADLNITVDETGRAEITGVWDKSDHTTLPNVPPANQTKSITDFANELIGAALGEDVSLYLNIHTNASPDGELRGQITATTSTFPDPIVSQDHHTIVVTDGELLIQVNGESKIAPPNTFVYISPGQSYAIANFGAAPATAIMSTVVDSYVPKIGEYYAGNIPFTGTVRDGDEYIQGNVVSTVPKAIGEGWIYTWGAFDEQGNPTSIGVTFTEEALDDAFLVNDPNNEFPRSVPELTFPGIFDPARVFNIEFPDLIQENTPFNHMGFHANSTGHAPVYAFDLRHFDIYFFLSTIEDRGLITGLPEDYVNLFDFPEDSFLPDDFIALTVGALQGMGWVSQFTPELSGAEFKQVFTFGTYAGKVNFWGPMITKEFIEDLAGLADNGQVMNMQEFAIKQPKRFLNGGYYPISYSVFHNSDHGEYTITLDQLTLKPTDGDE